MKNLVSVICITCVVLIGAGCRKEGEVPAEEKKTEEKKTETKKEEKKTEAKKEEKKTPEIVVGGLYAFPTKGAQAYVIFKVLALEKKIVHVRRYVNQYPDVPNDLDPTTLTLGDVGVPGNTGVSHMALGIDWFWPTNPQLLIEEKVTEEEKAVVKAFKDRKKK